MKGRYNALGSLAFTSVVMLGAIRSSAQLTPIDTLIPMRDDKLLAADVYLPNEGDQARPTILIQTPYWRIPYRWIGLPLGIDFDLDASAYNFVVVDWRGFWGSTAADTGGVINRGEDGYDCIDWIIAQPWSDGTMGTWGPSALAKVQFDTAREGHPAHRCAVPLVSGTQQDYVDYFPGGVLRREYVEQLQTLGFTPVSLFTSNPVQNIIWDIAEASTWWPDEIPVPCLMIGGWYDHNPRAMLELFEGIRTIGPLPARDEHRLLMGPWVHGGNSTAYVGSLQQGELGYPAAAGWSDSLALRFLDFHLRNIPNGWDAQPVITYFQMGDDQWHGTTTWPESNDTIRLYLHDVGALTELPDIGGTPPETFTSDPHDPTPTIGGPTLQVGLVQGPYDQGPLIETRSDVLTFTSNPLNSDISMQGIPMANLFVSTTALDADIAVRLTDVYPDGRSMLVVDGIRRLRFTDGYTPADTGQVAPGSMVLLRIPMTPTSITFKAGHKIRLDISGSNYPRFDANPQSGGVLYAPGDTVIAEISIHHDNVALSHLVLPGTTGSVGMIDAHGKNVSLIQRGDRIYLSEPVPGIHRWSLVDAAGRSVMHYEGSGDQFLLPVTATSGWLCVRCALADGRILQLPVIQVE